MTEEEVIHIMREHLEGLFPKVCSNCNNRFASLREYLLITRHQGPAMPYDADMGMWKPLKPMGVFTFANCPCGNTLSLSSHGIPLPQLWRLLNWARIETHRRHQTPQVLLNYLRDEICTQVLAASDQDESCEENGQATHQDS